LEYAAMDYRRNQHEVNGPDVVHMGRPDRDTAGTDMTTSSAFLLSGPTTGRTRSHDLAVGLVAGGLAVSEQPRSSPVG